MTTAFSTTVGWDEIYRPRTFAEVIGQKMAVAELQGMLKTRELPNGIIFYGPSGTGKTTLSLVLARYVNCATLNACGKCDSCKAMDAGRHPDVHHMNASAESGKDDVKGLIKNAQYAPRFNVRVFIIDEAQGMSKAAMEALLVPVEKPPGQTLYCFCTTEPAKLPSTLLGRVSNIEIKPATTAELIARLKAIAAIQKVRFPEAIYQQCAQSESSRVAVKLLQKAYFILKNDPKTPIADVLKSVGSFGDADTAQIAQRLLLGLYACNNKVILQSCYEAKDAVAVVNQCLFNNQFVLGSIVGAKSSMIWAPVNKEFLALAKTKLGEKLTLERVLHAEHKLADVRAKLVTSPVGALHLLVSTLSCKKAP